MKETMNDEHLNQVLLKQEEGVIFHEGKLSKKGDIWSLFRKMDEIVKEVLRKRCGERHRGRNYVVCSE